TLGHEPTSWTVFELFTDTDAREPVVRKVVWNRHEDLRKLHDAVVQAKKVLSLKPTFIVHDAEVPASELWDLLRQAESFHVPVVWLHDREFDITDAGSVGFEFFSRDRPPAKLRLEWSAGRIESWGPIVDWYNKIQEFLEACLVGENGSL